LGKLREQYLALNTPKGKLRVSEVIGVVKAFYNDKANVGAMFQVASQFNLLEMVLQDLKMKKLLYFLEKHWI